MNQESATAYLYVIQIAEFSADQPRIIKNPLLKRKPSKPSKKKLHHAGHYQPTMPLSNRFHHTLPDTPQKTGTEEPIHKSITSPNGTFPFLRPTHAHVHFDNQKLDWNSRDHRKGLHPTQHNERRHISTILRLEWWNISWWVAFVLPPSPPPSPIRVGACLMVVVYIGFGGLGYQWIFCVFTGG
jgi:hypothetical protein